MIREDFKCRYHAKANQENIVCGKNYRITVLSEGLLRLEYNEQGFFEDRATQVVWNRDFAGSSYEVISTEDGIEIRTDKLHLRYDEQAFSSVGLSIAVKENLEIHHRIWHYGESGGDLGGTARTLDGIDGEVPLESGIVSRRGYAILDDSRSQILLENGWIEPRKKGGIDLYFFGYGLSYKEALRDFYYLCGKTPMLPRFVFGNWWSRYYPYSEESYLQLMNQFSEKNIPFSVAVIDMDWHLVEIDKKYGTGWTGYTWNRELFPNPSRFLEELHKRGMKTTLNLHPADGVRAHEDAYKEMAKELGVDYTKEIPIAFDCTDPDFLEAYFKHLHHPLEKEGVDFWWIDWQQGKQTKIEGLDPLWILNHYHFLDSKKEGKRPMIFSRYAGAGSHRYPIGFSGDTIVTWDSLAFQPYFTATASNIGYGWWSHDIGGHMLGSKDNEMMARWVQFGIYSPIMRLHSSFNEFSGKEPWKFSAETEKAMIEALRQRHRLIPYLYSMNYRNYKENLPLILPMYYEHPKEEAAYTVKNQYYFGSELMVAPITAPRIPKLGLAEVTVWLPQGIWHDISTGVIYQGNRMLKMYRDLTGIPVFAKAGAILVLTEETSAEAASRNPESLTVQVYAGENGEFTLYEDDNASCDYEKGFAAKTKLEYLAEEGVFTIHACQGNAELLPQKRKYQIEFVGFSAKAKEEIRITGNTQIKESAAEYLPQTKTVRITIEEVSPKDTIQIGGVGKANWHLENEKEHLVYTILERAEIAFSLKEEIYQKVRMVKDTAILAADLLAMEIPEKLYAAILEVITAK